MLHDISFRQDSSHCYFSKEILFFGIVAVLLAGNAQHCKAEPTDVLSLPRINMNDFKYHGAFRLPITTYGDSSAARAEGDITLGSNGSSFFLAGKKRDQAIAEFSIPQLVNSKELNTLNFASNIQPFVKVLELPETGNQQNMNRIGGMEYVDGKLLVNTFEYYDAPADNTHTTLVLRDAENIEASTVDGFYGYDARAHASGWISPIPVNLQGILGGKYITGHSNGTPIIGRHSVGPSAFVIDPNTHIFGKNAGSSIPTISLADFSLNNPMGDVKNEGQEYINNWNLTNNLWTRISKATYGFIVPGTRTYAVIGYSGGHKSGIGYKITQDTGIVCPGPCAYETDDYYNYIWFFDLNDLLQVKNGLIPAHEVVPYNYGKFDVPFQPKIGINPIVGGTYDSAKDILYITVMRADTLQSNFDTTPVIVAYKLIARPSAISTLEAD